MDLEELIKECGDKFESLTQTLHPHAKYQWTACTAEIRSFGDTPRDAVLNLKEKLL